MWYSKAAMNGHPAAQYDLGVCHYNGKGVARNRDEAVKWWKLAAEQGYDNAKKALRDID
jgi:TPR repeat protein